MQADKATGIILAGGRSARMGRNKALLPIAGKPLVRHLAEGMLALGVARIVVACGTEARGLEYGALLRDLPGDIVMAADCYPDCGPLAGLHAALSAMPEPGGYGFVMACDMPVIAGTLFERMLQAAGEAAERYRSGVESAVGEAADRDLSGAELAAGRMNDESVPAGDAGGGTVETKTEDSDNGTVEVKDGDSDSGTVEVKDGDGGNGTVELRVADGDNVKDEDIAAEDGDAVELKARNSSNSTGKAGSGGHATASQEASLLPQLIRTAHQPFHALYHASAVGEIERRLERGDLRVMPLLGALRSVELAPTAEEEAAFVNLNTPELYEQYIVLGGKHA